MGGEWQGMTSFLSKPFTARLNLEKANKLKREQKIVPKHLHSHLMQTTVIEF